MPAGPGPAVTPTLVVLVHHAEAVAAETDPQQPLTEAGRRRASELGTALASRGVRPSRVWHSGKLRARQTALEIWHSTNALAQFAAARGLQPTDHPRILHDLLTGEDAQVVCVGHMPNLGRLLAALTGRPEALVSFPAHGAVALTMTSPKKWREVWRISQ
jgi:phosphohistidine phosphatase